MGARILAGFIVMAGFTGCSKKSGEATVVEKEHIDAGEPMESPTPGASVGPSASPRESGDSEEHAEKPLAEDEIVVETYVMKKNARGTSKDPRAYPGLEQWRVKVRIDGVGGTATVRAKQSQYERLKVGDRVKVRYSEGNYTGSVWSADIVD